MGTITDLISGIETKAGAFLTNYAKASYGVDVETNRLNTRANRFSVVPAGASQQDTIGHLVIDQDFSFKLLGDFVSSQLDDQAKRTATNTLCDAVYDLYEYLVKEKCGAPTITMNTYGLSVSPPEVTGQTVIVEFTFTVKYRR